MKALVLTAGLGKRLSPLTSNRSKAMLMIAGRPVIDYIFDSLLENDIDDVVIVAGHGREELIDHLQESADARLQIRYVIQHEQKGVEHAVLSARDELDNEEQFLLVNGDVLVEPEMVTRTISNFKTMDASVSMLVTLVANPEQYGTVKIGKNGAVEKLVEKGGPDRYVSNYAVAGVSVFRNEIFSVLEKHGTMENAVENMIADERVVTACVWEREWAEFTWPWDILRANRIVMDRNLKGKGSYIAETADVHNSAVLEGPIYIDEGAVVRPHVSIKGPVYIGKRVFIGNNSLVRDYSSLCDDVHIGYAVEIRNSMIFDKVNVGRMTYIADSLIGANSCIEAGVQLWNWRPGTKPLFLEDDGKNVKIPMSKFGAIIGDKVVIGVNASIYPGRKIGEGTSIAPGCIINRDIPPLSDVSVKQDLIITDREAGESC